MPTRFLLCALAAILLLWGLLTGDFCRAQTPAANAPEQLFTKKLEGGGELIFSRTKIPQPTGAAVAGLLKARQNKNAVHRIKVEVKPPGGEPIVLLETLSFQWPLISEFNIIDVYVDGNDIVAAVGNPQRFGMWHINTGEIVTSEWTWPDLGVPLSALGWPDFKKDNVRVKIFRNDAGVLSLEVSDLVYMRSNIPALLEQDADKWQFTLKRAFGGVRLPPNWKPDTGVASD
jgi:hypothetical protein